MLIDISPVIDEALAVWPGDVPFRRDVSLEMARGDNYTLSAIHTTVHVGAHADAPSHYHPRGETIEMRPLERYIGPCQVVRVAAPRGRRIVPADVRAEIRAPRVLFGTDSFPDPRRWNTDFNSLAPELVEWLHARGVVLVGIDTPSVDPFESKALEAHNAIFARDMAVLEGLALEGVREGLYELIAPPLRIRGGDASPVRAVLRLSA